MDYDRYDRQIRTFGLNATCKLNYSNVAIIGLNKGLSTEILKNLALCGIQNLFLVNDKSIEESDLLTGYYYSINDIGKFRHNVLKEKLCELNESLNIINISSLEDLESIDVLIVVNKNKEEIIHYNNLCRDYNKKFISVQSSNNNGIIFVDAGLNHIVKNIIGKKYESVQINNIDNTGKVTTNGHEFESGQTVFINNLNKEYVIEVINNNVFKLNNFDNFEFKFINGNATYIDKNIYVNHKSYEEQLDVPVYIYSDIEIVSVNSIMGSIVATETIKLLTNQYQPINQFFTWSDPDLLNLETDKLSNTEILIIGSGAVGCELLKNVAFLNVKKITIMDPDIIKKSNLSIQFLFHTSDIGKLKSESAANVIRYMKPLIEINSISEKISPETENIFNNKKLIVFNALDNIDDKRYVDTQCFNHNLPLFESSITGLKGNVTPVIPFVTETYSNSVLPPTEKSFPICTIKNFPNQITHTIYWALDQFEFFNKGPSAFNKWLENKNSEINKDIWLFANKKNFIIWALDMFHEHFNYQINELIKAYPEDTLTKEGTLFWSGGKICPKPIDFNIDIAEHYHFIEVTINLLYKCFNIEYKFNREDICNILKEYIFVPLDKDIKFEIDKNININKLVLQEFNKNDDIHIQWINTVSNLRAMNYSIDTVDYHTTKGIACKINPAVVTTASLVAGFATIEMIKYLSNCNDISKYKSTFINLALNTLTSAEPLPAKTIEIAGKKFNSWYKFIETDDLTIEDFINKYGKLFETNITMISLGSSLVYADFMDSDKSPKLSDIIKEYSGNILTISSDDENIDLPEIQINL